jgi:hypothetical protein
MTSTIRTGGQLFFTCQGSRQPHQKLLGGFAGMNIFMTSL